MTDIVERLRAVTARPLGMVIDPPPHPLCREAADEIERLRAENLAMADLIVNLHVFAGDRRRSDDHVGLVVRIRLAEFMENR